MTNSALGVRLSEDTRYRLEVLGKSRWEKYELTGETVDQADVKAWADSLDARTG